MLTRSFRMLVTGAAAVVVVGLAVWSAANAAPQRQGGTPTPPTPASNLTDIGVSGTGRVFAQPDTAIASVGVDLTGTSMDQATSDATTRMNAVLDKIKSMGVDPKDITTVSYNVNPITSSQKEGQTPQITGYHVSNIVQVKIRKLGDVGKILDAAMGGGANSLSSLYFTIDDPTSLQQQARTKAVADAAAKAKTLADAAGVKLGPVVSITEGVSGPRPLADRSLSLATAAGGGAPGPVESGQTEIDVTVEVHYQISQ